MLNTISLPVSTSGAPATEIVPPKRTSLYGAAVEYALHCVIWLIDHRTSAASSKDLADLQGVPPSMLAKIMPKLEKAGVVVSKSGIAGGYALACEPASIAVLEIVDAVEGNRRVFDCREVRRGCVLFGGQPPLWSTSGVCGIHAVMLRAEKQMRLELARTSLADLARGIKQPAEFESCVASWLQDRAEARQIARREGVREARLHRAEKSSVQHRCGPASATDEMCSQTME